MATRRPAVLPRSNTTKRARPATSPPDAATPARQLAGFLDKLEPEVARTMRAARTILRRRFPTANEVVYDNYNFFVIGYLSTGKLADCLLSIAANAKGVILSFYQGASLPDPTGLLQGSGVQNRFFRLTHAALLEEPAVEALLTAAARQVRVPLATTGKGKLVIRSISAKQRSRRRA